MNALDTLHNLIKQTDNDNAHEVYKTFMADLPTMLDDEIADYLQDAISEIEGYIEGDETEAYEWALENGARRPAPYLQSEFL